MISFEVGKVRNVLSYTLRLWWQDFHFQARFYTLAAQTIRWSASHTRSPLLTSTRASRTISSFCRSSRRTMSDIWGTFDVSSSQCRERDSVHWSLFCDFVQHFCPVKTTSLYGQFQNFISRQCDQVVELKVAQFSPSLLKKEPKQFYVKIEAFRKSKKVAQYLGWLR